jgi:opacity protein-like surface antigen
MTTSTTFRSAMKLALLLAAIVSVAGGDAALAQAGSVEITPMVGYRWGGQISKEDNPTLGFDADLEDSASYGLVIDIPVSYHVQIELSADHQSTGLEKDTLFAPSDHAFDIDVNYYHIGVLGQWPLGHVTPYVVGAVGVADLRPDMAGLSDSQRFSSSLGGGVKIRLADHVAFRFEARGTWSDTSDEHWEWDDEGCDSHHEDCEWDHNQDLVQGQIRLGITFWF